MINRFTHFAKTVFFAWILILLVPSVLLCANANASSVEVTNAKVESSEEGYRMFVSFSFELNNDVRKSINEGIAVSFITEVELSRTRWYWFAEKKHSSQTVKVFYNLWRQQYTVSYNGGFQQNFATLDEAMALVWRPKRWVIAEKTALIPSETYTVKVRLRLDNSQLSKTMQLASLSRRDWLLTSDWKEFSFKADDK